MSNAVLRYCLRSDTVIALPGTFDLQLQLFQVTSKSYCVCVQAQQCASSQTVIRAAPGPVDADGRCVADIGSARARHLWGLHPGLDAL